MIELPSLYYRKLYLFSDISEREYKRVCETPTTATAEVEIMTTVMKRPNNTHGQQFALLESLGVIEYLKKEYPILKVDLKLGELIRNIINRDINDTRTKMVAFTNTKDQSNLPKNQKVINDILIKIGIIQKD